MSRPIVLAKREALRLMIETRSDRWIWTDENGTYWVTAKNAAQPAPGAWIFKRIRFMGPPEKPSEPRIPGKAVFARKIPKPKT